MERVLTDGKTSIGAVMFPDRKRPCLCVERGNECVIYGHFNGPESAEKFMHELAQLVGAEEE
jgi:hypothetical protein